MSANYKAPKVKNLGGSELKIKEPTQVQEEVKQERKSYEPNKDVIGVKQLTKATNTEALNVITTRIKRHMEYLNGNIGFSSPEQRIDEQVTFIETIGNTLKLPYQDYVEVTNVLINQIRNNSEVFSKGLAFRFTKDLGQKYPIKIIATYETYMTLLATIATNWTRRHALDRLVDLDYGIQNLDRKSKENVTRYFKQIISHS